MKITLISGLWPSKEANGLWPLAKKLEALPSKPSIEVHHYGDSVISDADVYIGHSLGGERCVKEIRANPNLKVKYLALIEPVASGWFPIWFWVPGQNFKLPLNIELADSFKRKAGLLPPSSRILNPIPGQDVNFDIDSDHANAPKCTLVVDRIVSMISKL